MNIILSILIFRVSPHVFYTVLSHCEAVIRICDHRRARQIIRERKFINPSFSCQIHGQVHDPPGQSECADGANKVAL
jgi:hypothetical protein